jgi:endonuclease/exonuclease/phosphatase family metal-dependent hydrolase
VPLLAQNLGNYVYYPASVHKHHQQNFGNAVLSRWPIIACRKLLLLPGTMSHRQHRRIAAVAQIMIGETEIAVYSVHTGQTWMLQKPGMREIDTLAKDVATGGRFVIVGGDFNTHFPGSKSKLKAVLTGADLSCISLPASPTFKAGPIQIKLDHMFTRGMTVQKAGIWTGGSASDHFPIWADLRFEAK